MGHKKDFLVQKLRKSFKMGMCYPRKEFGSKPFEFLKNSIFAWFTPYAEDLKKFQGFNWATIKNYLEFIIIRLGSRI